MKLLRHTLVTACFSLAIGAALPAFAADSVMVGGASMYPNKTIVENAVNSKDHTTLIAAVKAASLVDTLNSKGPFTVFAPTNAAFAALPAGTVESLVKPENKATLSNILTYHVVAGTYTAKDLMTEANKTAGKTMLTTVQGEKLTVAYDGQMLSLTDSKGTNTAISIADVMQSNGVIHVIDKVLLP